MEKLAQGNEALVLDLLGGRLAFERTGVLLYESVVHKIELSSEPRYHVLLDQLRRIRDEEREHATWLEREIAALGGSADEDTSMSRLELEESAGIKSVIVDGHQQVLHLLHALLSAELADNAGWELLVKLADDAGDRVAKAQLAKRLAEEARHLAFIREAVVRAAEVEILGRAEEMPADMRDVPSGSLARSFARTGPIAAMVLGAGAFLGALLLRGRTFTTGRIGRHRRRQFFI